MGWIKIKLKDKATSLFNETGENTFKFLMNIFHSKLKIYLIIQTPRDELGETVGIGGEYSKEAFILPTLDILLLHKESNLYVLNRTVL